MEARPRELLYGRDDTPGIVSVLAGRDGRARVWRRDGAATIYEEERFPNWFLLSDASLLDGLAVERLPGGELASWAAQAAAMGPDQVGLVELAGDLHYRYLVVAAGQGAVEQAVTDAYNTRNGSTARALYDLRDVTYLRPPVE
jgi:hypothetical protein